MQKQQMLFSKMLQQSVDMSINDETIDAQFMILSKLLKHTISDNWDSLMAFNDVLHLEVITTGNLKIDIIKKYKEELLKVLSKDEFYKLVILFCEDHLVNSFEEAQQIISDECYTLLR